MATTVRAVVRNGRIELIEPASLPEGTEVLVTVLAEDEDRDFWSAVAERSATGIWDNPDDDVYAELLQG